MACITPYYVDNPNYPFVSQVRQVPVGCNKCPNCLKKRTNGWTIRLQEQEKVSTSVYFITLTYAPEHVTRTEAGRLTLVTKDLQDWFKRLRKRLYGNSKGDLKYYAVGEYGTRFQRPHYHAILFNVQAKNVYKLVAETWQKGRVDVQVPNKSEATCRYVAKYLHKGKVVHYQGDDRLREKSYMSKGLGLNYLTEKMIEWHRADYKRTQYIKLDGTKSALPRYYFEKIYREKIRIDGKLTNQLTELASWFKKKQAIFVENLVKIKEKMDFFEWSCKFGALIPRGQDLACAFARAKQQAIDVYLLSFKDLELKKREDSYLFDNYYSYETS